METRMRGFGAEVDRAICPSTVTGHSCAVGCVRIGAFHKRNSRSTWGSSSLYTTFESAVKCCWARSLSCSFQKTPDPNKSVHPLPSSCFISMLYAGGNAMASLSYLVSPCPRQGCRVPRHRERRVWKVCHPVLLRVQTSVSGNAPLRCNPTLS